MPTINIAVGQDIAAAIAASAPGDTLMFADGIHRRTSFINPKANQRLECATKGSASISGSVVLTGWVQNGARWQKTGQAYGEEGNAELFFANSSTGAKRRVGSLGAVVSGTWWFDTAADTIWVGDDPNSTLVELSICQRIIYSNAANLYIKNLIIEKATNGEQTGMIQCTAEGGTINWTLDNVEVRYSKATGYRFPGSGLVTHCYFHHNQQMHIVGGSRTSGIVEFTEMSYGRYHGLYTIGHEGGCMKIVGSSNFIIRNNWVHHNSGPGIWVDINNWQTLIEYNLVEFNEWMGIFNEISQDCTIRYNVVRNNVTNMDPAANYWIMRAGIVIGASHNGYIHDNKVENHPLGITLFNQARREYQPQPGEPDHNPNLWGGPWDPVYGGISGGGAPVPFMRGDHRVFNTRVEDNFIASSSGTGSSVDTDAGNAGIPPSEYNTIYDLVRTNAQNNAFQYSDGQYGSNRWLRNIYYIQSGSTSGSWFNWAQGGKTWTTWQAIPQDTGGSMNPYVAYTPSDWVLPPGWTDPPIIIVDETVTDSFTNTNGVDLQDHVGEVGADWTRSVFYATSFIIANNRVRMQGTGNSFYYPSGTAPDNEYYAQVDFDLMSLVPGTYPQLRIRASTSGGANPDGYWIFYDPDVQQVRFRVTVGGVTAPELGAYSMAPQSFTARIAGTAALKWVEINGIVRITSTDNSLTAIGKSGIGGFYGTSPTDVAGWHFNNFSQGPVVALNPTVVRVIGKYFRK